jgi:hypothetical protein
MARPVTGRKDSRGFHTAIGGSSTPSGCGGIRGAGSRGGAGPLSATPWLPSVNPPGSVRPEFDFGPFVLLIHEFRARCVATRSGLDWFRDGIPWVAQTAAQPRAEGRNPLGIGSG